jgi:hypothetical protein
MGGLGTAVMTPAQLYALFQSVGFSPTVATQMTAVALKESGGNPGATNMVGPDNSYGLTQINMKGSLGPARLQQCGLTSAAQLLDPATNAQCAFKIYGGSDANLDTAWGIDTWDAANYDAKLPIAEAASGIDVSDTAVAASTPDTSGVDLSVPPETDLAAALGDGAVDTSADDSDSFSGAAVLGTDSTPLYVGLGVAALVGLFYLSRR